MIDTHAHLDFPEYDQDREEVISRFFEQDGHAIINVGVDVERNKKSIEIAEKHDGVFASVGLHPEFFTKGDWGSQGDEGDWVEELKDLGKREKVVAIGETGLDYFRVGEIGESGVIRESQKKGFLAQIEIARELGLPVIVHCRDAYPVASGGASEWFGAWEDIFEIISGFNQSSAFSTQELSSWVSSKFVLHCYSGQKKDTEKFLKLPNVYFSFSGNITYPKPIARRESLAEAVRMIPLDKIMLDSDSPFLSPQEFRGKRNEPSHIRYIARKIAEIKGISGEEVEKVTDENARKFFELGKHGRLGRLER